MIFNRESYIKIFIVIISLFLIPLSLSGTEINFFINYNFVTFSSFDNFVSSKSPNFNIYLEYNPLIITYLNWNKQYLIPGLKKTCRRSLSVFNPQLLLLYGAIIHGVLPRNAIRQVQLLSWMKVPQPVGKMLSRGIATAFKPTILHN